MSSNADSDSLLSWRAQVTRAVMLWALFYGKDINRLIEFGTDVNARLIEGNTFLIIAVVSRHTESLKALIRGGADVNAWRDDGMSPLNVASQHGFTDIVGILIDNGADIESRDNEGRTPLYSAILHDVVLLLTQEGHTDCVKLLIQHGAEVDTRTNDSATPLYLAASEGCIEVVQFLIEQHADVNICCNNGSSCLWTAAFNGHTAVVRALVSAGADVNLQNNNGFSPLSVASQEGHNDCVKLLIQSGANVETHSNKGATPLYMAAKNGHIEVVQFLIEQHADVNACCSDGESCLWTVAFKGHIDIVRALVSAGADVNLQRNDGFSALSVASQKGHTECVKFLIQVGAEVDARINNSGTSLYLAASEGHIEVVQFLIEQHADVNACCSDGESCLWRAAFNGHTAVVRALVSAGADVNLQRNDGASPLSVASQEGHTECVKLLIWSGAKVETCSNKGATSMYWAAQKGQTEVVQFLIEQHAEVNACCSDGESCVMTAAFNGRTAVVRALLSAGADVNLQQNDGASALGIASANGHLDIVVMLLDSGADIEMRDNDGRTALWFAAANGHIDVLHVLIVRAADVDANNYSLRSPLCQASILGHIDIVNKLLRGKANISDEDGAHDDPLSWVALWGERDVKAVLQLLMKNGAYISPAKDCNNETALMHAVYKGDIAIVKMLVECGADTDARNVDNLHAIDIASYYGHVDIVRFLRDRLTCINFSHINHSDCYDFPTPRLSSITCTDYNNTAMHLTTDVHCMRSLLENGAEIEAENIDGLQPIHCAVRRQHVELVELLIQHGANVDAADVYGNRPLHEAVCHGLNVVKLLVHYGAKLNVQNVDGKTPLHVAIERQHSDVVMFLLEAGADVGLTDVWRNTPLHYLTPRQLQCSGYEECVVKQAKKYQHLLISNAVGVTALASVAAYRILDYIKDKQEIPNLLVPKDICSQQLAHDFSSRPISSLLELHHKEAFLKTKVYCRKDLQHRDCYGNTALHYAVGVYAHLKMYRVRIDVIKTVEFLVKCGADINAQNNDGLTPLHVARGKEAIEACLQHADDQSFTITDIRSRNFWHLLFLSRNENEIKLAMHICPIVSASDAKYNTDDLKRTPLHYACMRRNSCITEECIQVFNNEHINKKDRFGRTALHYAAMANNTELRDLLKNKTSADSTIQDNFQKTANEYNDDCRYHTAKVSLLRLLDSSSFVARNFHSTSLCIQQCFSDRYTNLKSSKTKLRKNVCDLRADNATSYVLNTYNGCCVEYTDVICTETTVLKQHKGVELLDNVDQSTTQLPSMFAAIQSQVEKAMQCLAKEISDKDDRFACEVVPVGSAYEGTKIGCCDEFDYNFVLNDLSRRCTVCCSAESPPGFVLLKASTAEYDNYLFNSNKILNIRIVKFKFETLVKQILSSLSFCEATGFEFIDPIQDSIAAPGTASTKLNTQIILKFTESVNGYNVPHNISVDVVPAVRIDDSWPDDMHREDLCQPGDCLIVFTQPHLKYPWIGWTEPHGFISFARAESRLLQGCSPVIKAAFMVVKRMSKYFCQYAFFSSHVIKTALLLCLDEMVAGSECSSSNNSHQINGDELLSWVQNILRRLLCFAAQDYVPSYFMPKCHQPIWLKERYLKQCHMHLHRHGLLTYTDLFTLNEQQSRDFKLKYIKSLFIFSHLMYWTVLSDNDELKLFVPSTINPLTENDVCTTLLLAN